MKSGKTAARDPACAIFHTRWCNREPMGVFFRGSLKVVLVLLVSNFNPPKGLPPQKKKNILKLSCAMSHSLRPVRDVVIMLLEVVFESLGGAIVNAHPGIYTSLTASLSERPNMPPSLVHQCACPRRDQTSIYSCHLAT